MKCRPHHEISTRSLAERSQRSRLHPTQLHSLRRRERLSRRPHNPHPRALGKSCRAHGRRTPPRRRPRHRCLDHLHHHRARPRLHRSRPRTDRRTPNRRPSQARHHALRRHPPRPHPAQDLWTRNGPRGRTRLQIPQDAQRRRLRRLHRRDEARPPRGHRHRPSRFLRSRQDHRRLPPRAPLRHLLPHQDEGGRQERDGPRHHGLRPHPQARGDVRADPRPPRARGNGGGVRLRRHASGPRHQGGDPVALPRLPRRRQGAERRRHVHRPHLHLPRLLRRSRSRRGRLHGGRDPGTRRPLHHEAAHGALPPRARLRRDLLRRSHLGHRVPRRHGRGRPAHGHQDDLPLPPHARQPRSRTRAQPHRALEPAPARALQALLRRSLHPHVLRPVRERHAHAPQVRGRLRHRLLRLRDAHRQAAPVLRRACQPRQGPAVRHQRRHGRLLRQRPSRPRTAHPRRTRPPRVRRGHDQLQQGRRLARQAVHGYAQHDPLHARQILLRTP